MSVDARKTVIKVLLIVVIVLMAVSLMGSTSYAKGKLRKGDEVWFGGKVWIVLDPDRVANDDTGQKGALLLSKYVLYNEQLHNSLYSTDSTARERWDKSWMRRRCSYNFEKLLLDMDMAERSSIITAVKHDVDYSVDPEDRLTGLCLGVGLSGDRLFPLNAAEVFKEGLFDDIESSLMGYDEKGNISVWWTRSIMKLSNSGSNLASWLAYVVNGLGSRSRNSVNVSDENFAGVRPAFYLDTSHIVSMEKDSDDIYKLILQSGQGINIGPDILKTDFNTPGTRAVYFGHNSNEDEDPILWEIMGWGTDGIYNGREGTMTLLSKDMLDWTRFSQEGSTSREYSESLLKKSIDGIAEKCTAPEKAAISERVLESRPGIDDDRDIRDDFIVGQAVQDALFWPMSCKEAKSIHRSLNYKRVNWYLRTGGLNNSDDSLVDWVTDRYEIGIYSGLGGISPSAVLGVCPATRIRLDHVLFTSSAKGGKVSGETGPDALEAVQDNRDGRWKLTVLDSERKFSVKEESLVAARGKKVMITYHGATPYSDDDPNEYVSAAIVDKDGNVLCYGHVSQPDSADGTASIKIPSYLPEGEYTLKIFSEQCNGDYQTDNASSISDIDLTVRNPHVAYIDSNDQMLETEDCDPFPQGAETLSTGWYEVYRDTELDKRLIINGSVNIILHDGATLSVPLGINLKEGNSLTIWGQSFGENAGKLVIENTNPLSMNAGIGGDVNQAGGTFTLNSGSVSISGFTRGAGIGGGYMGNGGNVKLYGGALMITSGVNAQAIGYGLQMSFSPDPGSLTLGRVEAGKVSGGSVSYVKESSRGGICRNDEGDTIYIERCRDHELEANKCKYCGTVIEADISNAEVILGDQLVYNGDEQKQTVAKVLLNGVDILASCFVNCEWHEEAGKYTLTVIGNENKKFTGSVEKEYSIAKATPEFNVTCNDIKDNLDVSAAKLERSSDSVPGTLKLTETALKYGKNTYHWNYTPADPKNYESVSGTVEITVTGHEWIDATCTEPKKCSICGATEGEPLGHSWEFKGFDWTGDETNGYTKAAAKFECGRESCDEENQVEVTPGDTVIEPKCEEGGKTVYTAVIATDKSPDKAEHKESKDAKLTNKLGHDWKDATCTEPKTCSRCQAAEGNALGHSFTKYESNKDVTCTKDGTKTAKCDRCDVTDTVTDEGSALGHDWKAATCTEPKTCSRCHTTEGEPLGHTWKAATCVAPKTCIICGATEGELDFDAHEWGDWQVTTEPAPNKNGVRTRICKRDPSHVETEKIAASGKLLTKMTSKGKNSLVITWTRMNDAAGYEVYFAQCNHKKKKNVCRKIADVSADKKLKYTKKKLKKKTSYKAFVMAYRIVDGVKVYADTSLTMHTFTSGRNKKYTNPAKVTVKKSKYTLDVGQTMKIKGKVTKPKKNKKLKINNHAPQLRFISSLKDVATVNKKGKIKARKKGSCKIYVIAVNGVRKTISITVR